MHEYKVAYGSESVGPAGSIGVNISLAIGRELTDDEKLFVYKAGSDLYTKIVYNNQLLDPDVQKGIENAEKDLLACFPQPIYWERIPNGYSPSTDPYPWYRVTTTVGHFVIGWRKRVISIDWSRIRNPPDGVMFKYENVTYDKHLVHAWGYDKAKNYIERIIANVGEL